MPDVTPNIDLPAFTAIVDKHFGKFRRSWNAKLQARLAARGLRIHGYLNWFMHNLSAERFNENTVCSQKVMDAYAEVQKEHRHMAEADLAFNVNVMETELALWEDPEYVLTDASNRMGPLHRHVMAKHLGFPELAARYAAAATVTALSNPELFTVYGKLAALFPVDRKEAI